MLTQVVAATGDPRLLEPTIRGLLARLDPQLVMHRPMTLDDAVGAGSATRTFTLVLVATFAGIAVVLAALGLFGALSYTVRMRSREFGIRRALGAQSGAIRRMVIRSGLSHAAVGAAIGLVGAVASSRLLASAVFEVDPLEPWVLIAAVGLMAIVAAVAAYLPARRATIVDPRTVLE
jgi:ABC-type antimicrobial peptide transport system permease subunit